MPHATFFREFGGLLYDGVAFTMAGFKVPHPRSEGLLASSEEQAPSGSPQPAVVETGAKSLTSVNPAEFAALVESGEIASITTKARHADERYRSFARYRFTRYDAHCFVPLCWCVCLATSNLP